MSLFSPQFLCVLCVLLLLQAMTLAMALIFEKKVKVVSYRLCMALDVLSTDLIACRQASQDCFVDFPPHHHLCVSACVLCRQLRCFRAPYGKELNTTTTTWTSKISWTMSSKR